MDGYLPMAIAIAVKGRGKGREGKDRKIVTVKGPTLRPD